MTLGGSEWTSSEEREFSQLFERAHHHSCPFCPGSGNAMPRMGHGWNTPCPDRQWWNNGFHGRTAGAATQRALAHGCLGPPGWVHRAGRRHRGTGRDVVGIHAVAPGRRSDHLVRRCRGDVVWVLLVTARASRATAWVLVDAIHAHPRHSHCPVAGSADLTAPSLRLCPPCGGPPSCRPDAATFASSSGLMVRQSTYQSSRNGSIRYLG